MKPQIQAKVLHISIIVLLLLSIIFLSVGYSIAETQGMTSCALDVPGFIKLQETYGFTNVNVKVCFAGDLNEESRNDGNISRLCNPGQNFAWDEYMSPENQVQANMTAVELHLYTMHAVVGPSFTAASIFFNILEFLGWFLVRLSTRFDSVNCVLLPLSSILIILCAISSGVCLRAAQIRYERLVVPETYPTLRKEGTFLPGSILIIFGSVLHVLVLISALRLKRIQKIIVAQFHGNEEENENDNAELMPRNR